VAKKGRGATTGCPQRCHGVPISFPAPAIAGSTKRELARQESPQGSKTKPCGASCRGKRPRGTSST
jgi:hypothetical protein